MRVTLHMGKASGGKAYSSRHNDRNFDTTKAAHIDPERTRYNMTWHRYGKVAPQLSFDAVERKFYRDRFGDALKARNSRYKAAGHPERVKTMDEYRRAVRTCPDEVIYQIGKKGETVSPRLLWRIVAMQINWEAKAFPQAYTLSLALHVDEQGAPHIHARRVWVGHDKDGHAEAGMSKALREMGIGRPDPDAPEDRYNNPKQTYTSMLREHFVDLCREHGLEIDVEPQEASRTGLSLLEYQNRQARETEAVLAAEIEADEDYLEGLRQDAAAVESRLKQLRAEEARRVAEHERATRDLFHEVGFPGGLSL